MTGGEKFPATVWLEVRCHPAVASFAGGWIRCLGVATQGERGRLAVTCTTMVDEAGTLLAEADASFVLIAPRSAGKL
jgi:hypothetical protein